MQLLKPRCESKELKIFRLLNLRMELSESNKQYYLYLEKGYEGELKCDALLEAKLVEERLVLCDLLFEINNTIFQIDMLIISPEAVYPLEIKNLEGDHYYKSDEFYRMSTGKEIKNPLLQLKRNESLLRQLFHNLSFQYSIKGSVIFINPAFTLYQAPMNQPIFYPTQLTKCMNSLNQNSGKLETRHTKLAEKMLSLHVPESRYSQVPEYRYGDLKKGSVCGKCGSFLVAENGYVLVCGKCGCIESKESVISRNISELKILFPEMKITTNGIHEWCGGVVSKKLIRNILKRDFNMLGQGKYTYFVDF